MKTIPDNNNTHNFFTLRIRPWPMATSAGTLLIIFTTAGFLGRFWWGFDLLDHFRVQYFIGLFLLSCLFGIFRKRVPAMVFLVFSIPNLLVILPFFFADVSVELNQESPKFRALLVNVNTESGDPAKVKKCVTTHDPDFIIFEEINTRWKDELSELHESYPFRIVQSREDNFGIAFFSRIEPELMKIVSIGITEAPSVVAQLFIGKEFLTILGTHPLPPAGPRYSQWRNTQLNQIPKYLTKYPGHKLVLGDLNVTPWSYHYKKLITRSGLQDSLKGNGIQPTWPVWMPAFWIPIDHCLFSAGIKIYQREVLGSVGSDHFPLLIEFGF